MTISAQRSFEAGEPGAMTQPGQLRVIKRNGTLTPYTDDKIAVAITKAFLAVEGNVAADSRRVHEQVKVLTQAVSNTFKRRMPGGGTVHIEEIQDQVELALMRSGEQKVARAYVIYREERSRLRNAGVTKPHPTLTVTLGDGSRMPLDLGRLEGLVASACEGLSGVEPGDIIVKFDGKAIDKSSDLPRLVGNTKPGTKSTLTVFRRGATKDLGVVIAEIEPEKPARRVVDNKPEQSKPSAAGQALGLSVSDLSDAQKAELKLKSGVKVDAVANGAARAGLREGDVITQVANTEVSSVKQFEAAVAKLDKSKPVNVLFRRGDLAQFALIRPAAR